jgi:hypothetical protein
MQLNEQIFASIGSKFIPNDKPNRLLRTGPNIT